MAKKISENKTTKTKMIENKGRCLGTMFALPTPLIIIIDLNSDHGEYFMLNCALAVED